MKPNTLKVRTPQGLFLPLHDNPRSYVTDAETVEVPNISYYQRAVTAGDLVIQADEATDAEEVTSTEEAAKTPAKKGAK